MVEDVQVIVNQLSLNAAVRRFACGQLRVPHDVYVTYRLVSRRSRSVLEDVIERWTLYEGPDGEPYFETTGRVVWNQVSGRRLS